MTTIKIWDVGCGVEANIDNGQLRVTYSGGCPVEEILGTVRERWSSPNGDDCEGPMTKYKLRRDGQRPLLFEGELLASVTGGGDNKTRYWTAEIYRRTDVMIPPGAPTGEYVMRLSFTTSWENEVSRDYVRIGEACELAQWARGISPLPDGCGYPPGQTYADKHNALRQRLQADLDRVLGDVWMAASLPEIA